MPNEGTSSQVTSELKQEAEHVLLPAAITALMGALVNVMRHWIDKRRKRAAVAESVAEIREVVIAPDNPNKDDLRKLVEDTRIEQRAQKILIGNLTDRFDRNLVTQAGNHSELMNLLRSALNDKTQTP